MLALSVSQAENGTRECDRISVPNKNGTVDRGLWQLNSQYHPFIPDCYKNTDRAVAVYEGTGKTFIRWSAFNNKSFEKFQKIFLAEQESYLQAELNTLLASN